jgi:diguanylate cyclase (GGDEF)-like protein
MSVTNNFHILIVDDEELNIELAAIYLKEEGYSLSFALNAKSAIESVIKNDIDLILLDINMPGKDGFEVCKLLKDDKKSKDIPVIFVTAQTDIKHISRAFEVGGVDYISKPFNGVELKARVKTHLHTLSNINEIKEKQSKLAQLSITDPLTKLYNSLYLDAQLKSYTLREETFWFVYIKIDRFEKLNQVYGFHGANKIIKKFGKIIKETAISNAVVARLYGVGFGVLMNDYEIQVLKEFYDKLYAKHKKDKELSGVFSFSTVLYNIKEPSTSITTIYKRLQTSMHKIENEDDRYTYIK